MQWDYMMVEEYLIEENYNRVFRDCVLHKHFLLQKKNQICVAAPENAGFYATWLICVNFGVASISVLLCRSFFSFSFRSSLRDNWATWCAWAVRIPKLRTCLKIKQFYLPVVINYSVTDHHTLFYYFYRFNQFFWCTLGIAKVLRSSLPGKKGEGIIGQSITSKVDRFCFYNYQYLKIS